MAKHNRKGRSIYPDRFSRLYHYMQKSEAWKSLDTYERCTFLAIKSRYNGSNNGDISMSILEICDEVGCHNMRAQKSIKTLKERGFIKEEQKGSFEWKIRYDGSRGSRATTWILTDESQDLPLRALSGATKEFMKWKPDETSVKTPKKTAVITKITNRNSKNYHNNKMVIQESTNDNPTNYQYSDIDRPDDNQKDYTYNIPYTPSKNTNGMGG